LLNRTKWRGKELRLERAKEHYMARIEREKKELAEKQKLKDEPPVIAKSSFEELSNRKLKVSDSIWKKGKNGRLVSCLRLRTKDERNVSTHSLTTRVFSTIADFFL
jgi:hypothetical protein